MLEAEKQYLPQPNLGSHALPSADCHWQNAGSYMLHSLAFHYRKRRRDGESLLRMRALSVTVLSNAAGRTWNW